MERVSRGPIKPGVAAFILAGGKSSRMGQDKAFLAWQGETLLEHALGIARVVAPPGILGARATFQPYGDVVEDVFPGRGPLAGIHAALSATDQTWNLILAVDLPFVTASLIRYLVQRAQGSSCIAIVPRLAEGWEPLCAVYRKEFADVANEALTLGRNAIHPLLDGASRASGVGATVLAVAEIELENAGFSARMFRNINTAEDFESYAQESCAGEDSTSTAKD